MSTFRRESLRIPSCAYAAAVPAFCALAFIAQCFREQQPSASFSGQQITYLPPDNTSAYANAWPTYPRGPPNERCAALTQSPKHHSESDAPPWLGQHCALDQGPNYNAVIGKCNADGACDERITWTACFLGSSIKCTDIGPLCPPPYDVALWRMTQRSSIKPWSRYGRLECVLTPTCCVHAL